MSNLPSADELMFGSQYQREAYAKRIQALKEQEEAEAAAERQRIEAEAKAKAEKQARIEEKRKQAEAKLAERARKAKEELDADAEALRQQRLQQEREQKEAAARAQQRAQDDAKRKAAEERAAADRQRKEQEDAKRAKEEERERKRQEKEALLKQHEEEADRRYFKQQVLQGKVQLSQKGGQVFAESRSHMDIPKDLRWVLADTELRPKVQVLDQVPVDVPEEKKKKKHSALNIQVKAPARNDGPSWIKNVPDEDDTAPAVDSGFPKWFKPVVDEPEVKEPERVEVEFSKTRSVVDASITKRLDSKTARFDAVLDVWCALREALAAGGKTTVQQLLDSSQGQHLMSAAGPIARILQSAPANIPALLSLGVMQFSGHPTATQRVKSLNIIPTDPDEWLGWVFGAELFASYAAWKQSGGDKPWALPVEKQSIDSDGKPAVGKAANKRTQRAAAERIVDILAEVMQVPGVTDDDTQAIMARFGQVYSKYMEQQGQLANYLTGDEKRLKVELNSLRTQREADEAKQRAEEGERDLVRIQRELDEQRSALRKAKQELERVKAQKSAAQDRYDITASRAAEIQAERRKAAVRQLHEKETAAR